MASTTAAASPMSSSLWAFGTRQVVYAAIGAALYGLLSWASNFIPLPSAGNVTFRPAIAVLVMFGSVFGPWVGFLAGALGNTLGDALSPWGLFWNWSLGNGLIGLISGLVANRLGNLREPRTLALAVGFGVAGNLVGMLFASLTEMFTSGIDLNTALIGYFTPAFIGNAVVTIILLPILLVAYSSIAGRLSR